MMTRSNSAFPQFFPDPSKADAHGLVVFDENFDVPRILDAYRHGIFPWPARVDDWDTDGSDPADMRWQTGWYSPDPRAILPLEKLHTPRRLQRKLDRGQFRFTWDQQFDLVIDSCATMGNRVFHSWLSPRLIQALKLLHRLGYAHSIEVYSAADRYQEICGGLYGVAVGAAFSAESMFHTRGDASKAGFCALVKLLTAAQFVLLDIQLASKHMNAMGAIEIPRRSFLEKLCEAVNCNANWASKIPEPIPIRDIAEHVGRSKQSS